MEWLTEPWIALAALTLSAVVAVVQLVGFLFRIPRAHWVLDRLEVDVPGPIKWGDKLTGERTARFTMRNAGTATAYMTTVRRRMRAPGFPSWLLVGDRRNMTMPPESTFEVEVRGCLTQRNDVPISWSSGDGFWFQTDEVIQVTWTHHPARIPLTQWRLIRLEKVQLDAKLRIVELPEEPLDP